jgi:hypothetical protein
MNYQNQQSLGTIHLRRWQIFTNFRPLPPTVGSFYVLSVGKFGKFLTPPPLRHADVLNGWSLRILKIPNIDSKTVKNEPLAEPKLIKNSDYVPPKLPKLVKLRHNLLNGQSKKKNCGCCACSHAYSGEPFIADWPFMLKYEDQVNLTNYSILFP